MTLRDAIEGMVLEYAQEAMKYPDSETLTDEILKLVAKELLESKPKKKILEVEEPHLYQGVGGDSAPFYCSACQSSEMKIMDNKEGDKYFCACSYWTDPHNAYIDKSGGKWLGWKDKSKAQEYLDSLPIEENGYNQALQALENHIRKVLEP